VIWLAMLQRCLTMPATLGSINSCPPSRGNYLRHHLHHHYNSSSRRPLVNRSTSFTTCPAFWRSSTSACIIVIAVWSSSLLLGGIALVQAISSIATHFSVAWSVCLFVYRLSHSCTLLKPFNGFACHLAGTLAGYSDTLC